MVIPVKLNSATAITQLKIGTSVVPESAYELQEGAILLSADYMNTLSAGKYRVLPTFNDKDKTTISNIQLVVYAAVEDRGAPYLLQHKLTFNGQDVVLTFDPGYGDLEALNVLALQVDDKLVLPDGKVVPFSTSNVRSLQKAYKAAVLALEEEEEIPVATSSNATYYEPEDDAIIDEDEWFEDEDIPVATPANAVRLDKAEKMPMSNALVDSMKELAETGEGTAFYVEGNNIHWSGSQIESMNLSAGDHLVGAVFDNT